MIKIIRKYFITILSLSLILSNFSFASHLMLCGMSKDATVCECNHSREKTPDELSFTVKGKKCCTDEITELKNSNVLSTVKVDLPKDINLFGVLILSLSTISLQNNAFVLSNNIDKEHVPKVDIPILVSSLLI